MIFFPPDASIDDLTYIYKQRNMRNTELLIQLKWNQDVECIFGDWFIMHCQAEKSLQSTNKNATYTTCQNNHNTYTTVLDSFHQNHAKTSFFLLILLFDPMIQYFTARISYHNQSNVCNLPRIEGNLSPRTACTEILLTWTSNFTNFWPHSPKWGQSLLSLCKMHISWWFGER